MGRLSPITAGAALFLGALVAGCGGASHSAADAAPQTVREETPAPVERGVDPGRFTPYFGGERGGAAVAALNRAEYASARELFLSLAASLPSSSVLVPRARFVAAVCAHRDGQHGAASRELEGLVEELPLLADHSLYLASVSAYRAGEHEHSRVLAERVSEASPLRADAELVAGDALRALARYDEVERAYTAYVQNHRGGPRLAEATFKLGEAIERQLQGDADVERVRDAVRWYRRVTYRHPRTQWARDAVDRITALSTRLPAPERSGATKLSAEEQLEVAQAYARAQRHRQAMGEFDKVLSITDPDGPVGCQARLGKGRAAFNARKRQLAGTVLSEAARRCDEPDVRAWSLYFAGRSRTARGRDGEAIALYESLENDYPEHRLADDARLRRADALVRLGRDSEAASLLGDMSERYPSGDMRCEGAWTLGWRTYRAGDFEGALAAFRRASDVCDSPAEGAHGRELYWAGRTLQRLGRVEEAATAFREVVRGSPLTYYMMLALNRLEALDSEAAAASRAQIAREPDAGGESSWRFDPAAVRARPSLVRGIELHRLSLASLARAEFAAARAEGVGEDPLLWLVASLHHQVGDYPVSHNIARRELTEWRATYPVGDNRRSWHVAYPRGFEELVLREASASGVEPELIWAVMREESGFSPAIESFANAVGLMQLLPSTASRFAKGLPAGREALKRPENNVPIAARYLAWLLRRTGRVPLLSIASYNAGERAVDRWRRGEPELELDEALESFTYNETRRYTRRVLSTYGVYHWLYSGRFPVLTDAIAAPPPRAPSAPEAASSDGG